jgi:phosphate transport system protein
MTIFQHELEQSKKRVLSLCALVEEHLKLALRALTEESETHARVVIENDYKIDQDEVSLEEECLKILALHQPVAIDLRFIVAILKINSDLERIGDQAVNIAKHVIQLRGYTQPDIIFDFAPMSERVIGMVSRSIDALIQLDIDGAREVCLSDDEVDRMNVACAKRVEEQLRTATDPADVHALMHAVALARDLERIADHATNIAEDVLYLIEGEIVRHHTAKKSSAK